MFCALWGAVDIRLKLSQIISAVMLTLAAGCAVSRKTAVAPVTPQPALSATKPELIDRYNHEGAAVQSITAAVRMLPTAGSALSGVIEKYHEVSGYILAERPASIRVIGQAPVVAKDIFDMASDGETFRMFIPSKNEFIEGPADLRQAAKRPIENLRPQHLLDTLIWPTISSDAPVLLEEVDDLPARYYVLTIARNDAQGLELERKVWFDRVNLQIVRMQIYDSQGIIVSDIQAKNWQPAGAADYPRDILLKRPVDDYRLEIVITQLTLNQPITADRFHLAQPAGTQLVRLGEDARP